METPQPEPAPDDSFLEIMLIWLMNFKTPVSAPSWLSPSFWSFASPKLNRKGSDVAALVLNDGGPVTNPVPDKGKGRWTDGSKSADRDHDLSFQVGGKVGHLGEEHSDRSVYSVMTTE
jgi:hypothetical protein